MCENCSRYNLGETYIVESPGHFADDVVFTHCPNCGRDLKLKSEKFKKVYCKDCISCHVLSKNKDGADCLNENNMKPNWFAVDGECERLPSQINEHNNCPWFISKMAAYEQDQN